VTADPALIRDRLEHRSGHYMPASLLDSQLALLEPLSADEPGVAVSGAGAPDAVLEELLAALSRERGIRIPHREASP
jgi:gluconokinase